MQNWFPKTKTEKNDEKSIFETLKCHYNHSTMSRYERLYEIVSYLAIFSTYHGVIQFNFCDDIQYVDFILLLFCYDTNS